MITTLKAILLAVFTTLPLQAWGLDCSSADIYLDTQEKVDTFQATYGGGGLCDTVTGILTVSGTDITNLDGLDNLAIVGGTHIIRSNAALTNIDGLANLTSVSGYLYITSNAALTVIDGLANLTSVRLDMSIHGNAALTSVDGLSLLGGVGNDFSLTDNPLLSNCTSLSTLLDDIDDYDPGPGPGVSGIPDIGGDVTLQGNSSPCNSIDSILGIIFKDGFEDDSN